MVLHRIVGLGFSFAALSAVLGSASCGSSSGSTPSPAEDGGGADASMTEAAPPPPACAPKLVCGTACVDTTSDAKNCGSCGAACKGAELCVASNCTLVPGFAIRKIYLGETDRSGAVLAQAWASYGRNIDGIASVVGIDNGECKRFAGAPASTQTDGNAGIDNSWGRNIVPMFQSLLPNLSKSTSDQLEAGARTPMLQFAVTPTPTGPSPFALVTAEATIAPKWDGFDSRPVADSSVTAGKPKTVFATGAFAAGILTSGDASAPFVVSLSLGGAAFEIPIRLARITMTLAADGKTATEGTISGVVDTEELVASFKKVAGALSTSLCGGSTLDSITSTFRQASDILVDGTQDPAKDCNAISIGLGFEAAAVAVGAIATPVAPAKDPCVP